MASIVGGLEVSGGEVEEVSGGEVERSREWVVIQFRFRLMSFWFDVVFQLWFKTKY